MVQGWLVVGEGGRGAVGQAARPALGPMPVLPCRRPGHTSVSSRESRRAPGRLLMAREQGGGQRLPGPPAPS